MSVATYGVDGLYVEVGDRGGWHILDFIGSGGALDSLLPIGNDWARKEYDISYYEPGDTIRLRFRFVSDESDEEEGFYIDDISVTGIYQGNTGSKGYSKPVSSILSDIFPNPAKRSLSIRYILPRIGELEVTIYDVTGRKISTIYKNRVKSLIGKVFWNGRDGRGNLVSTGIYFVEFKLNGKVIETKKFLFFK